MGRDGMIIEVGQEMRVIEPQPTSDLPDLDNRAVVLKAEWKCENGQHYMCEAGPATMTCGCR